MSSETLYELKKQTIEQQITIERLKFELAKMKSQEKTPYIHTILGEWEEVYSVQDVSANLWTEDLPLFQDNTIYYQTYGGGPEGGYFVKTTDDYTHPGSLSDTKIKRVWKVQRSWFQPWKIEKLDNVVLEYEPADESSERTARCRLIEVANLTESYHLNRNHLLWGNATEIVKCLRDGLGRKDDAEYKDLCLGSILYHFYYLDKYLDLLPKDTAPSYKEVLADLFKKEQEDDISLHKDEDSDCEDECEECGAESGKSCKEGCAYQKRKAEKEDEDSEDEESEEEKPICEECKSLCKTLHQKCDNTEAQDVSFVCDVCVKK